MRAGFCIQAGLGQAQPFYRPPANQVLLYNRLRILGLHIPVPNRVRVDHDRGPMLALVEAAGFIDSHPPGKARLFRELLQPGVQFALSILRARGARRIGWAHIVADENVVFKSGQAVVLLKGGSVRLRFPAPCNQK